MYVSSEYSLWIQMITNPGVKEATLLHFPQTFWCILTFNLGPI